VALLAGISTNCGVGIAALAGAGVASAAWAGPDKPAIRVHVKQTCSNARLIFMRPLLPDRRNAWRCKLKMRDKSKRRYSQEFLVNG
jgi:hypothetical protein